MKIGIFGGTFNPIHKGHLALINRMIERLALDRLILMPAAVPPHKDAGEVIPAADRVATRRRPGARPHPVVVIGPCLIGLFHEGSFLS